MLESWDGDEFTAKLMLVGKFAAVSEDLGPLPNGFVQFQIGKGANSVCSASPWGRAGLRVHPRITKLLGPGQPDQPVVPSLTRNRRRVMETQGRFADIALTSRAAPPKLLASNMAAGEARLIAMSSLHWFMAGKQNITHDLIRGQRDQADDTAPFLAVSGYTQVKQRPNTYPLYY